MENVQKFKHDKPHLLRDKTFHFAIRMVRLFHHLKLEKHEFTLSKQLLRSGTNPGAMVREALNAESNLDYIHKLAIAQKELAETQYWLELLHATQYLNEQEFKSLYEDATELMKITRSSILTKKKNLAATAGLFVLLSITALSHLLH